MQLTVTQQSSGGATGQGGVSQEVLSSSVALVGGEGGEVELTGEGSLAGAQWRWWRCRARTILPGWCCW